MKYAIVLLSMVMLYASCHFDFTHHQNGHELFVSLRDETQKIWVVFVEKNPQGDEGKEVRDQNAAVKNQVKQRLYNEDVFYTELALDDEDSEERYKEFTELVALDNTLLEDGPVVILVYNKKGYWIHGHGIPQETVDTIHAFIVQKEDNDNKNKPVSVGGPVKHPSSFEAFEGGSY